MSPLTMFTSRCVGLLSGLALLALTVLAPWQASADEEHNVSRGGVAIHGFDPVAYHKAGKPTKGLAQYSAEYEGVRYLFASSGNRSAFTAAPAKYAPAYGGWCSYGVRVGKKFDVDPAAWQVVDGRLFLQLDPGTQKVWLKDTDRNIAIADRIWPSIMAVPAKTLAE